MSRPGTMHRRFRPFALPSFGVLALGLILAGSLSSCATPFVPPAITPDLGSLADGTFTGSYDAEIVRATAQVRLAGHQIEAIELLEHNCGPAGKKGEAVVGRVLAAQRLEVDVVSGATTSSKVILKAIEAALQKAAE